MDSSTFTLGHCASHAPRYAVTCGGISDCQWFDTEEDAFAHVESVRSRYAGSGIFPTVSVLKTTIVFQKEVDMDF